VIRGWSLFLVIWQECEQAVWVAVTVCKLHGVTIGDEALDVAFCRNFLWDDTQENAI